MKVAFVHDRIISIWWAEKVFIDLIKVNLKKDNPTKYEIFCIFSDKKYLEINWENIKINSIISNKFILEKIDYRNLLPILPILTKNLSKKINNFWPDKSIISSFACVKNIDVKWEKILYMHSPMQYIRDMYEEYKNKLNFWKKLLFTQTCKILRKRDKKHRHYDKILFNSQFTKILCKKIYDMKEGEILYPRIWLNFIQAMPASEPFDYYLYVWRLVKFSKEVDLIIKLFNELWENLLIMWSWKDEIFLKSIANDNIVFIWQIDDELWKLKIIRQSLWLINLTKESFWIATAEALAVWVPVFGFKGWATPELVDENSWFLVEDKELESLIKGFKEFLNRDFDRSKIKDNFIRKYEESIQ